MRIFVFLLLVLFAPRASAFAQETCALTLNEAPTLFGLKLRMSPAEVKTIFGRKLKLKVKREGTFFQNFTDKPPPVFLNGVRALYLRFFDRKLYQIEVFYANETAERETAAPSEAKAAEFAARLSASLNLPESSVWTNKFGEYELKCAGFSIAADRVLNPRVELTDDAARAVFQLRIKN